MGDTIEQWRASVGHWSGGRPRQCVTSQHHIAQTSNHIGYKYIRFLVLVSLLVIGCVELNPGPDHETSAQPQNSGALPKFRRRPGSVGLHGELYGVKMAAFLFARALNKTEEFRLASNVDGAGDFDDLVFRYRLREPDVWKTCFIQLKHKKKERTIRYSSLTQMSGDFSLLKYFKSFCEIKNNASLDRNLKECGLFVDFEFVIYTNARMEGGFTLQGGDSDPLSILSSGTNGGKYVTFDKTRDKDIFRFFEDLSDYHKLTEELDSLLEMRTSVDKEINEKIKRFQISVARNKIFGDLDSLKSKNTDYVTTCIDEIAKCDFTLFEEFLSKVKIFHSQSNEEALKGLTEKELQQACKASPSVANFIYTKFEEGFSKWWNRVGSVVWINENSRLWQEVQNFIINEINEISEPEIQEIVTCGMNFNEQNVQGLLDDIKQKTILKLVKNSSVDRILQKKKTYQALNTSDYKNPLFINIKSLILPRKEFRNFWPCKWSDVLVVDCGSDGNVAQRVEDILQNTPDFGQGLDISDDNMLEPLFNVLQKNQQKVILISHK